MSSKATRRPGWVRVVVVPHSLDELDGALSGLIGLPTRMFWSGPAPATVRWDLSDPDRRRDLYEIVLTLGDLDDIRRLVNRRALLDQWTDLYLPPWVRDAWRPLIDSAETAA
ncbi:MAG: hypothetical protein L0I76_19860 [Pseudonocardia sp.]|nr:hypothetical protein [Pseudonocardia sp.]